MEMPTVRQRSAGATTHAILLGWLGVGSILNSAWPLIFHSTLMKALPPEVVEKFPPVLRSPWMSVLGLACGFSALATARALWRLSPSAVNLYLVWAGVTLVFCAWMGLSTGFEVVRLVAYFVPTLALLGGGWLRMRRLVQP